MALGKSDVDVALLLGVSAHEYGDIEQHEDELETAVSIRVTCDLCKILDLSWEDVYHIPDVARWLSEPLVPAAQLIEEQIIQLGLSLDDFAETIGFSKDVAGAFARDDARLLYYPLSVAREIEVALELPGGKLIRSLLYRNGARCVKRGQV